MEEYKEAARMPLRFPSSSPGWAQKLPARQEDPCGRIEAETGSDAIRKDKDSFRIVFPEGRGWLHIDRWAGGTII